MLPHLLNNVFYREMALEGLFLGKDQGRYTSENINLKHPKLTDMLDYIVRQQPQLLESSELREERLLLPSQTYAAAIRFLLQCFEADVEQNIAAETTPEFLASLGNMCLLLEHAMAYEGSVELHATASKALIKIGSHFSEVYYLVIRTLFLIIGIMYLEATHFI